MMLTTRKPEIIDLEVMKLNVAAALARDVFLAGPPALEVIMHDLPEQMARQLVAHLKVPAQVLQSGRVIARWPVGLWDYIKRELINFSPGLFGNLRVRYNEALMTEHLVYPHISVPRGHGERVRLAVMPELRLIEE